MDEPTTAELIKSARDNATCEGDDSEGGAFSLVTLDADLFEAILARLQKHTMGGRSNDR